MGIFLVVADATRPEAVGTLKAPRQSLLLLFQCIYLAADLARIERRRGIAAAITTSGKCLGMGRAWAWEDWQLGILDWMIMGLDDNGIGVLLLLVLVAGFGNHAVGRRCI